MDAAERIGQAVRGSEEARSELTARARLICGEGNVLTDPARLELYRHDGIRRWGPNAAAVILPASASEVAGVAGACAELGVGFTVRGAGTSIRGGALPQEGMAMVVLTRMRRMQGPLNEDGEITVEPGVSIRALRELVGAPVLEGAFASATVGGHVASTRGLRGVTAIEIVEPDGSRTHSDARHAGYDFAAAFCGSAGVAGIAVSIGLRVAELL